MMLSKTFRSLVTTSSLAVASLLMVPLEVDGAVIVQYKANEDSSPIDQGWTGKTSQVPDGYRYGTETFNGVEYDYMRFNTSSNTASGVVTHAINSADFAATAWTLTAVVRVELTNNNLFSSFFRFYAGKTDARENTLSLFRYDDGTQIHEGVVIRDTSITDGGAGKWPLDKIIPLDLHSDYVTLQLYYDPLSVGKVTQLYANGVQIGSVAYADRFEGNTPYTLEFGRGTTTGSASVYWNEVRLETGNAVIPEPSAVILMGAVGVAALAWRHRR